ncbi:MAG: hypothetical protein KUG68_00465 [Flavobacteriaceae bacterium]|nr:hypothetical protein [Flavobacteriaceae bacterium]
MLKKLLFLIALIIAANSCTRDDLCSEATQKTSKLVIAFKNFNNPLEDRTVSNLTIISDLGEVTVVDNESIDSVNVPLNTGADLTSFRFIKYSDDEELINPDTISFNYQRVDEYINRACSFKTVFFDLNAAVVSEDNNNNWIRSVEIINDTIENEDEAHITIYH